MSAATLTDCVKQIGGGHETPGLYNNKIAAVTETKMKMTDNEGNTNAA